jgi:hypothetical protein
MRYLDKQGKIAWKASLRFLTMLADAEREAQDDLEDFPSVAKDVHSGPSAWPVSGGEMGARRSSVPVDWRFTIAALIRTPLACNSVG